MPTPVERARAEIADIKERESNSAMIVGMGAEDLGQWGDWSETQRLFVLAKYVDWDGVSGPDKLAIIESEVDLSQVDREAQRDLIPDLVHEADRPIRPLTEELIACCQLDVWPGQATIMDFGLDSTSHLGALQFAIREELVTPQELDAAMGNGAKLTEIAQRGENPYRFVAFQTPWDDMGPEPDEFDYPESEGLAAEIHADEHAARAREYGEADAATFDQRVAEGEATVQHLEPESPLVSPAELEPVVADLERQWSMERLKDILDGKGLDVEGPEHDTDMEHDR